MIDCFRNLNTDYQEAYLHVLEHPDETECDQCRSNGLTGATTAIYTAVLMSPTFCLPHTGLGILGVLCLAGSASCNVILANALGMLDTAVKVEQACFRCCFQKYQRETAAS